jgi:hypothetical protein
LIDVHRVINEPSLASKSATLLCSIPECACTFTSDTFKRNCSIIDGLLV